MWAGDLHDVGTVLGERAGTSRSSKDASQVEDADAREWPITGWQRLGGAVADAHDLHEWQRCDRSCLRMSRPFRLCPRHAAGALCSNDRLLEIGGVPGGNCARHCVAIFRYAEHAECRRAMIGKIAVEIGPAPVPGWIEAHDSVSRGRNSCAGELNVLAAAQRSCGLAKINCHSLTPPGTSLPQLRRREPSCSESCSTGRADAERRRQHRIG